MSKNDGIHLDLITSGSRVFKRKHMDKNHCYYSRSMDVETLEAEAWYKIFLPNLDKSGKPSISSRNLTPYRRSTKHDLWEIAADKS